VSLPPGVATLLRAAVAHSEPDRKARSALQELDTEDLHGLARGADFHGISAYVLAATEEGSGLPPAEREQLRERRRAIAIDHLRMLGNLRLLRELFDAADVPWLIVKGPTLAQPVHGDPILRGYADLDAVVPGTHLRAAVTALTAAGARPLDRNWTLLLRELKGEIHLALPSGTELDLHWHLLNDRDRRDSFQIPMAELFQRTRIVRVGDEQVPTLDDADTVVYVALHSVLSGADRLIWLKDVERLLHRELTSPQEIAARARQWNAELALTSALECVEATIGLPRQGHELRAALPPYRFWTTTARTAWRPQPIERADGSGSLGRMTARSVRATQAHTLRRLAAKSAGFMIGSLRGVRTSGHRSVDPNDPGSGAFDAGGDQAREAYLDAVAQQR